ncbi:MAG: SIS domain-containing protein [Planctomycetes bacterium]|nr:SIS domain-containing protein [Planctomycetota bacterium]
MSNKNDNFFANYLAGLRKSLDEIPADKITAISELIYQAYLNNKQIFVMGNGGSAATASHFVCDLGKGSVKAGKPRFRIISLNDNTPLITALANDLGYDKIFAEQLMNLVQKDDIVICISASGNSPNILRAIEYANSRGATTVSLLGFDGGKARNISKEYIVVANKNYEQTEDVHLILAHAIAVYFRNKL